MRAKWNFAAGPAMLPTPVLEQIQADLFDWQGSGMSVMEMSHRGSDFQKILMEAEADLRCLTGLDDDFAILFLPGGARVENALLAMNLISHSVEKKANYVLSGFWSRTSFKHGQPYGDMSVVASSEAFHLEEGIQYDSWQWAPDVESWQVDPQAAYVHYCHNETLTGVAYKDIPDLVAAGKADVPVVADMTSCFLSRRMSFKRAGMIYVGAQKNAGIAGLSIVIIRKDLLGKALPITPHVLNYEVVANSNSCINTPPTFPIYVSGLVFKWILQQGGLEATERSNISKSQKLYDYIASTDFYRNPVAPNSRSICNVSFFLPDRQMDSIFLEQAKEASLINLKGHSEVGGMRASIYNAMPEQGIDDLIDFMREFERTYG